jgi:starch synthase (maltosyl-transferring)
MLIGRARNRDPYVCFFAESLGCSLEQSLALVAAGHDFIFNSDKWWDYRANWFIEQNNALAAHHGRSIGFPESHDTARLANEWKGDLDRIKQHYLFTAFATSGVLIPLGFEYGFKKNLHVVHTNSLDYEGASYDLTDFIRQTNRLKLQVPLLAQDGELAMLKTDNDQVLVLQKKSLDGADSVLLIFNRTAAPQTLRIGDLLRKLHAKPLVEKQENLNLERYGVGVLKLRAN